MVIFTGGMEELTLDQIKTKSELEEDVDFENGDFLYFDEQCCKIMVRLLLLFQLLVVEFVIFLS